MGRIDIRAGGGDSNEEFGRPKRMAFNMVVDREGGEKNLHLDPGSTAVSGVLRCVGTLIGTAPYVSPPWIRALRSAYANRDVVLVVLVRIRRDFAGGRKRVHVWTRGFP